MTSKTYKLGSHGEENQRLQLQRELDEALERSLEELGQSLSRGLDNEEMAGVGKD